jgi:hypothetical protein
MEACKSRLDILARSASIILIFIFLAVTGAGCVSQEETNPARSATEQLLLSTATDRALSNIDLTIFAGHNVYVDFTYFEGYDAKYVESEIRDAVNRAGASLAPSATNADITVEARSGGYSIDTNNSFIGIPAIPIPIPGTAEMPVTPSIALYQKDMQLSYAKFQLLAYSDKTHAHIYSSGPIDGKAYKIYHEIFFLSWWRTDIPEENKEKKQEKFETWHQQYDLENMPDVPTNPPVASSESTNSPTMPTNSPATSTNEVKKL